MGAEQSTMHGGGLLGGCLPPVRSMYDAKKTDEWQADSRGPEPLNRMKARASTVAGDGGASNVMVAPGVEYIAKQKVDEMCDMFHEVMKDVWVRLGDLRAENGNLKRTVKELAGLVALHETGEAPGDWARGGDSTQRAGSVSVETAAATGRVVGSSPPSAAARHSGTPPPAFALRTPTGGRFASPVAGPPEPQHTPLSLSTPAGMQHLLRTLSPPDGRGHLTPEQVELVERGWLELAVENLMAKNDALHRRVEELGRLALGDQEAGLLAEAAVAALQADNGALRLQRDMLQHRVQALEQSLQETVRLLDDERRDHDDDQRSWAASLAEREQQVAALQLQVQKLKLSPPPFSPPSRRSPKKVSPAAAAAAARRQGTPQLNPMLTSMAAAHELLASLRIPGLTSPRLFAKTPAPPPACLASFLHAVKPASPTPAPTPHLPSPSPSPRNETPRSTLDSPVPLPATTPRQVAQRAQLGDVSNTAALRRRSAPKRKEVPPEEEHFSPTFTFGGSYGLDSMGIPYTAY